MQKIVFLQNLVADAVQELEYMEILVDMFSKVHYEILR